MNQNDVSWSSSLDIWLFEVKRESTRNTSISELIGCFLDFEFLIGPELGVSRKEGEFAIYLILYALLAHALVQWFEIVVKHLQIVLTSTNITGISDHSNLRLNLTGTHHNSLYNHKRTNLICLQITNSLWFNFCLGTIHNSHIIIFMDCDGNSLRWFE